MKTRTRKPKEQAIAEADAMMADLAKLELASIRMAAAAEDKIAALKRDLACNSQANQELIRDRTDALEDMIARIFGSRASSPRSRTCAVGRYGKHIVYRVRIASPAKVIAYAKRCKLPLFKVVERVDVPAVRAAIADGRKIPGASVVIRDQPFHSVDRRLIEQATAIGTGQRRRNGRAAA